jgi:hypothetical protein
MGEGLVNLVDDATNVVERNELTSPVLPVYYTLIWDWRQKDTVSLWFDMMAEITLNMLAEGLLTEAVTSSRQCVQANITFDPQPSSQ